MAPVLPSEYSYLAGTSNYAGQYWYYRGTSDKGPGIYYGNMFVAAVPPGTSAEDAYLRAVVQPAGAGIGGSVSPEVQQTVAQEVGQQQAVAQVEEAFIQAGINPYPMESRQYARAETRIVQMYGLPTGVLGLGTQPTGAVGPYGSFGNPYNPTAHGEFMAYETIYRQTQEQRLAAQPGDVQQLFRNLRAYEMGQMSAQDLRPQYQPKPYKDTGGTGKYSNPITGAKWETVMGVATNYDTASISESKIVALTVAFKDMGIDLKPGDLPISGIVPIRNIATTEELQLTQGDPLKLMKLYGEKMEAAKSTPTLHDDREYAWRIEALMSNEHQYSASRDTAAKIQGLPIAPDPNEYMLDLFAEYQKGTGMKPNDMFSPVSGELIGILPERPKGVGYPEKGGYGAQEYWWDIAVAGAPGETELSRRKEFIKDMGVPDYGPALDYVLNKAGAGGPYATLGAYSQGGFRYSVSEQQALAKGLWKPLSASERLNVPEITESRPSRMLLADYPSLQFAGKLPKSDVFESGMGKLNPAYYIPKTGTYELRVGTFSNEDKRGALQFGEGDNTYFFSEVKPAAQLTLAASVEKQKGAAPTPVGDVVMVKAPDGLMYPDYMVPMGNVSAVSNRNITGTKRVAAVATIQPELPSWDDYYKEKQSEYASRLKAYELAGSSDYSEYQVLKQKERELRVLGNIQYGVSVTRSIESTQSKKQPDLDEGFFGINTILRQGLPKPGTPESENVIKVMKLTTKIFPTNPISLTTTATENIPANKTPDITGFIPGTPQWYEDTYASIYKDPSRSMVTAAIPIGIGGLGAGARIAGAGETWLVPGGTGSSIYSAASTAATTTIGAYYASDILKRTTGVSINEIQMDVFGFGKETYSAGSGRALIERYKSQYPGLETTRKELNMITTQELAPLALVTPAAMFVSQKVSDKIILRGTPEISKATIKTKAYLSDEGFPTNPLIKTADLKSSFESGTITLKRPSDLSKTIMDPYGKPLTRIPVGTQIGAKPGESFVYSGAEFQHLQTGGMVGESYSEVTQAMYVSPQGLSYFTKPGNAPGGLGFGISSDILGIYKSPTLFQIKTKKGEVKLIPPDLLSVSTGGKEGLHKGINSHYNPRNIAISKFMATKAEFGKVYVGQYGKSEWQGLIRTGTAIKSAKRTGWFSDAGSKVRVVEVELGGKQPGYEPRTKFEIEKYYAKYGTSSSPKSQRIPFVSSAILESKKISEGYNYQKSSAIINKANYYSSSGRSSSATRSYRSGLPKTAVGVLPTSTYEKFTSAISPSSITSPSYPKSTFYVSSGYTPESPRYSTPTYTPKTTPSITKTPTYRSPPPPIARGTGDIMGSLGSRPYLPWKTTRWKRDNPVADIPYLSRGLGGSGKQRKRRNPFSGSPFR